MHAASSLVQTGPYGHIWRAVAQQCLQTAALKPCEVPAVSSSTAAYFFVRVAPGSSWGLPSAPSGFSHRAAGEGTAPLPARALLEMEAHSLPQTQNTFHQLLLERQRQWL